MAGDSHLTDLLREQDSEQCVQADRLQVAELSEAARLECLRAAQATADRVIRTVADHDGGPGPRLMVAVIDPETKTRLATGFVTVQTAWPLRPVRHLRPVS